MSKPRSMRKKYSTALDEEFPETIKITIGDHETIYKKHMSLRYGENPHQPAAFYSPTKDLLTIGEIKLLKTGKSGLSMTNVEDANNSMRIVSYFRQPACAVMKHVNPSGAATKNLDEHLVEVYKKARDCDSLAAFGSVVGFNCEVDVATAEEIMNSYVEGVVAPSYEDGCMDYFEQKKNIRIMQVDGFEEISKYIGEPMWPLDISVQMDGSLVLQAPMLTKIKGVDDLRVVTQKQPSDQELKDLLFSWYICMNVRSNGVVLGKKKATIGIGTGQQDRVTAVKLALEKADMRGHKSEIPGSVLASDGFFPFRDSIDLLAEYGVTACIQPGGSVKDKEVIEACNENGIAMVFTDERCFRHF
jgi:phosphoribosylaminoimidazolecarboxamide formyltransferase/IMP cyclohydrolase